MNFLYKESMCRGTNKGLKQGDLNPGWEEQEEERGKEQERAREIKGERGKKNLNENWVIMFVSRAVPGGKSLGTVLQSWVVAIFNSRAP